MRDFEPSAGVVATKRNAEGRGVVAAQALLAPIHLTVQRYGVPGRLIHLGTHMQLQKSLIWGIAPRLAHMRDLTLGA